MLQTKIPVIFNERVQPIAISKEWIRPGKMAVICGFGNTLTGFNFNTPVHLGLLIAPVISNGECSKLHRPNGLGDRVLNTVICTLNNGHSKNGFNYHSAAKGDSGGGLVVDSKLVGVASLRLGSYLSGCLYQSF